MNIISFKLLQTLQNQFQVRTKYGPEFIADIEKVKVGFTPRTCIYREGPHCLYYYPGKKEKNIPVLLVYSLINRPYIFDLRPNRSLIEYLCSNGFDVYLLDWGDPLQETGCCSIGDLVGGTLHRCVLWILKHYKMSCIRLLGYCMGGTFATIYTAIHPENIDRLILLTTPLGKDEGGILPKIASNIDWAQGITQTNLISGRFLKWVFNSIRPSINRKKEQDFWQNFDKDEFLEHFLPVEKWSNDTPDIPECAFYEFLDLCFRRDLLKTGQIQLNRYRVDFTKVKCPVFSVVAQHDWIVPPTALDTVQKVLLNAQHIPYLLAGGHIGLVVGKQAFILWKEIEKFLN